MIEAADFQFSVLTVKFSEDLTLLYPPTAGKREQTGKGS